MASAMNQMRWNMIAATEAIEVGATYYLAIEQDQKGAMVKVLSKSTETNSMGWPSSVHVEVVSPVGFLAAYWLDRYAPGKRYVCGATDLHKNRADAKPAPPRPFKFRRRF